MADNRIAYGLAKKYGIDTTGMSPKEVWEALRNKGVTEKNIADGAYNSQEGRATVLARQLMEKRKREEEEAAKAKTLVYRKGVIRKIKSFEGQEEGTYDYNTGNPVNLKDGYMVTFHQNEPDKNGHYKSHYGRYTEQEYDDMTNKFAKENNAKVYVGVFDGEPEISFRVKDFNQAMDLTVKHNQKSFWDNVEGKTVENKLYDKTKNPMRGD